MGHRMPNGYGSVVKLSGNRARPYAAKVTVYDADAHSKQVAIGYADTKENALMLLAQYNNHPWNLKRETITLAELYQQWLDIKAPKLAENTVASLKSAFKKYFVKYYGMKYRNIRAYHMQDTIDSCDKSYSMKGSIKALWGHLDKFAFELDIIDKMYSQLITAPSAPETSRTPFEPEQIEALWNIADEPFVDTVLIFLYTGFRRNELLLMTSDQVNTKDWYFKGGEKTASGKDRIVPIHDRIKPFVTKYIEQGNEYFITCPDSGTAFKPFQYRKVWDPIMDKIGASGKTPHEAHRRLS